MVSELTQAANVPEKRNVKIDSSNITDNRKFCKRKTYCEAVKEKKMKRQDKKVFDLKLIKENLLRNEVL